jgi:hypothetical protein
MTEDFEVLLQKFKDLQSRHFTAPEMYFFGAGGPGDHALCESTLDELSKFCLTNFYEDECTIPFFPVLKILHDFISPILKCYVGKETDLMWLLLQKLIPSKPLPLRSEVLQAMCLAAPMIQVGTSLFRDEPPLPARVNGYCELIASVGDSELRISLCPSAPPLPPWLRIFGTRGDDPGLQERLRAIHQQGTTQLHCFMSVIATCPPSAGVLRMFEYAIRAEDLSFATAICALAGGSFCVTVMQILAKAKLFDHFLRSLACAVLPFVAIPGERGQPLNVELTALTNCFWAVARPPPSAENIVEEIKALADIRPPPLAAYILRAALAIAAYANPAEDIALGMFLEIVVHWVAERDSLGVQFADLKKEWLHGSAQGCTWRPSVEDAICRVLDQKDITFRRRIRGTDRSNLYQWAVDHAQEMVDVLIYVNNRQPYEHPPVQTLFFALNKQDQVRK